VPYSKVEGIMTYCPVISTETNEKFLCANVSKMKMVHSPTTASFYPSENADITYPVPVDMRTSALSIVKWYPTQTELEENRENTASAKNCKKLPDPEENEVDHRKWSSVELNVLTQVFVTRD